MQSVDEQLETFENLFKQTLDYNLYVNINLNYWEEFDKLDPVSATEGIDRVCVCFRPLIAMYSGTPVENILMTCLDRTRIALFTAMNVPFPRNPLTHVDRVISNVVEMYYVNTYSDLRVEMLVTNHYVQIVQRNWRSAITDPSHPACKRRLMREFNGLEMVA
jgi:hypothetical protein